MVRLFRRFRRDRDQQPEAEAAKETEEVREEYRRTVANTKRGQLGALRRIFRRSQVDDDFWEDLEETLILGDVGGATSAKWVEDLRQSATGKDALEIRSLLRDRMIDGLNAASANGLLWTRHNGNDTAPPKPHVVLVVGVNGAGKKTSIAKIAHAYQ